MIPVEDWKPFQLYASAGMCIMRHDCHAVINPDPIIYHTVIEPYHPTVNIKFIV